MKKLLLIVLLILAQHKFSYGQELQWVKAFGSPDNEFVQSVTTDAQGNSYIIGTNRETIQFDPVLGIADLEYSGVLNSFIAKYNAEGEIQWAKKLGESSETYALVSGADIIWDNNGYFYVTGEFQDRVDFDLGPSTAVLASYEGGRIFLAKYDADGNYVWAINFGGGISSTDNAYPIGQALEIDAVHNVYITGKFAQTSDFNPGSESEILNNIGKDDIFIAKYDAAGKYIWAKGFGGTGNDKGKVLKVSKNFLYVGGTFEETIDSSPEEESNELRSNGSLDFFLSKYDLEGNHIWSHSFGGIATDYIDGIVVNDSDELFITGSFNGEVSFSTNSVAANLTSNGNSDVFIAKYQSNGDLVWVINFGSGAHDFSKDICINSLGTLIVTGSFGESFDIDPGQGSKQLSSQGYSDIFIAKFDTDGQLLWADGIGGTSVDAGNSVAVDKKDNVYLTGRFAQTVEFAPDKSASSVSAKGANDVFIARFSDSSPSSLSDEILNRSLSVFPNPATDIVFVTTQNKNNIGAISVTDLYGKVYKPQIKPTSDGYQMGISNLHRGIYFVTIETKSYRATKKIVIK